MWQRPIPCDTVSADGKHFAGDLGRALVPGEYQRPAAIAAEEDRIHMDAADRVMREPEEIVLEAGDAHRFDELGRAAVEHVRPLRRQGQFVDQHRSRALRRPGRFPIARAVSNASSATGMSLVPAETTRIVPFPVISLFLSIAITPDSG